MVKREQLAQKIDQLLIEEIPNIETAKEPVMEECDSISKKCDTIIAKIKIKNIVAKIKVKRAENE